MDIEKTTLYRHMNNIYKKINISSKYSIFKFDIKCCGSILYEPILTRRIYEILSYMIQGCTEKEISENLGLSVSAIKKHNENIFKYNINISSVFQFISFCIIYGKIEFIVGEVYDG